MTSLRSQRYTLALGLALLSTRGLAQPSDELEGDVSDDASSVEVGDAREPEPFTEPEAEEPEAEAPHENDSAGNEMSAEAASNSTTRSRETAPPAKHADRSTRTATGSAAQVSSAQKPGSAPPDGAPVAPESKTPVLSDWSVTLYGFAAFNAIHDSTQSLVSGVHNSMLARRGTFASQHSQLLVDTRDSRIGLQVRVPEYEGIIASMRGEMDFRAPQPTDNTESQTFTQGVMRMRHLYMKVQTPIVDVLAGQYHNLFGWGGAGYFPATLAFLGVTGQVYSRQGQLRLSKTLSGEWVRFETAVAGTRPASRASGTPDLQGGLRLGFPVWTGAQTSGYGQPSIGELGIGASGILRYFKVAEFTATPADSVEATGAGVVVNAFLPIIPASSVEDRGNALSVTAEASYGTGISDMYTDLTGGALFPTLPNPTGTPFPTTPYYVPNIDSGIVTFDENLRLRTIDWKGLVVGAQYYLPIDSGRVWVAGIYSRIESDNIVELTPIPNRGLVFEKAEYIDGSLFVAVTNSVQMGVGFQTVKQTFGDGATARNNRTMGAAHLFF